MFENERKNILLNHSLSPRCFKSPVNKRQVYSWKNYLNKDVSQKYGRLESRAYFAEKSQANLNESWKSKQKIEVSTNTPRVSRFGEKLEISQTSKGERSTMLSFDFDNIRFGSFLKEESLLCKESQSGKDDYHEQLKQEQRLYLFKKFMDHVEKVHGIRL